jgi:hypothetical protein
MTAAMGRTANLPAGTHTVQILANVNGPGQGWLGDSGLWIDR